MIIAQHISIYAAGMKCFIFFITCCSLACSGVPVQSPAVSLNQAGYFPGGAKEAMVMHAASENFFLLAENKTDTVLKGLLGAERKSPVSALSARIADFSAARQQGNYWLLVPGSELVPVTVQPDALQEVSAAGLKAYYYQRSDIELVPSFAGQWARPAGHPDTKVIVHPSAADAARPAGTIISSPGGWYDAGDYNKYIVNSGITMGTLLAAYEDFPGYFDTLKTTIPESGNAVPDILDEVLYNLRWMLTMQDPGDGGVYHKCTNAAFDGMVMPGVTKDLRYVVQKSTAATLDFAATAAQAARVYKEYEQWLPGLADSCIKAAEKAWKWAKDNSAVLYEQEEMNKKYKPVISTGGYGDKQLDDEWFWAAAELYISTGENEYTDVIKRNAAGVHSLPGWPQVGMPGIFSLLRHEKRIRAEQIPFPLMKERVITMADQFVDAMAGSLGHTAMGTGQRDFIWGSNAVAANQGMLLLNAYTLTKQKKYADAALSNMDYLLGKNATGYSFVTGIGYKSPLHPHHRPSVADGVEMPIPGLLVGGPNANAHLQDKCTYIHKEAERQYTDALCSYASNEIAINWNAPLVYLAGGLSALAGEAGYR